MYNLSCGIKRIEWRHSVLWTAKRENQTTFIVNDVNPATLNKTWTGTYILFCYKSRLHLLYYSKSLLCFYIKLFMLYLYLSVAWWSRFFVNGSWRHYVPLEIKWWQNNLHYRSFIPLTVDCKHWIGNNVLLVL
jgi:hypothetical protein